MESETTAHAKKTLTAPPSLTVLATTRILAHDELYKVIDLCNRTLRDRGLVFGLSKENEQMTVTIYET